MDSYTARIELSNACRQCYVNKTKAVEEFKRKLGYSDVTATPEEVTSCDDASMTSVGQKLSQLKSQLVSELHKRGFIAFVRKICRKIGNYRQCQ